MIEHVFEALPNRMRSADVVLVVAAIGTLGSAEENPAELIEQIARLEELKAAAAAAQARATAVFAAKQRADRLSAGVPGELAGKGLAAQIGLARRESPHWGARDLGLAEALVGEMPDTLASLQAGEISEWRATLIVRETACLSKEHRRQVDAELAACPGGLTGMGDRAVAAEAKRIGYRLDPYAVTRRASNAAADRHVSLRPAPNTMTWLGALLPAREGVAAYAALVSAADTARAGGDQRSRSQVMADTLTERVTGQISASAVPIEVQLIMTETTLLAAGNEPAELQGVGPIPAPLARRWLRGDTTRPGTTGHDSAAGAVTAADGTAAQAWVRRLYTAPTNRQLVAMDSKRRCFDGSLRRFVIAADRICRTPWCDAPIRHIDHPTRAADGGQTSVDNSQGLCEACNYAREAAGWRTIRHPGRVVETITPTGHTYRSSPPPPPRRCPPASIGRSSPAPPGRTSPTEPQSTLEQRLTELPATA